MTIKMQEKIAWINGKWGSPSSLKTTISDRGLNLGDGIFETILILKGKPILLNEHLNRWYQSSIILNMDAPPDQNFLQPLINEALEYLKLFNANGALRLNWSRGDSRERGIEIPFKTKSKRSGQFWLELTKIEPYFNSIKTIISEHERKNAYSRINLCKTFSYNQAIQARYEARCKGHDDALLLSTNGDICCGTTSNLLIRRNNQWLTPEIKSGCLPGIMRQQGINAGIIKETKLSSHPKNGDNWLLINSLSCQPIHMVNNQSLSIWPKPRELWLSLIEQ